MGLISLSLYLMNFILFCFVVSLGVGDCLGWISWWWVVLELGWERCFFYFLKVCEVESMGVWLGGVDGLEDGGVGNDVVEL